jgi:hypothetical protein
MQWQQAAVPNPPAVVRGVAPEVPAKFVLPRPEALGVATSVKVPAPQPVQIDWQQVQTRMERVGVVGYRKATPTAGVVRVTIELRTTDPARRYPVEAQGETEGAAILGALQTAEALMQRHQ